jgi:hypothetical protein
MAHSIEIYSQIDTHDDTMLGISSIVSTMYKCTRTVICMTPACHKVVNRGTEITAVEAFSAMVLMMREYVSVSDGKDTFESSGQLFYDNAL